MQKHKQTQMQTLTQAQTDREREREREREMYIYMYIHAFTCKYMQTDRQTDRQTDTQIQSETRIFMSLPQKRHERNCTLHVCGNRGSTLNSYVSFRERALLVGQNRQKRHKNSGDLLLGVTTFAVATMCRSLL